jgi:hypothetical protein
MEEAAPILPKMSIGAQNIKIKRNDLETVKMNLGPQT